MNDSFQTSKRERFSAKEKSLLLSLISKRKSIIEGRKSDNISLLRKSRAWQEIQDEFNSQGYVTKRSWQQLRKFWCNEKHLQKKMAVEEKRARGEDVTVPDVPIELLFPESQKSVVKPVNQDSIEQDETEDQLDTAQSEIDFEEEDYDDIKIIEHGIEESSDTIMENPARTESSVSLERENSVNDSSNASENISDGVVEESNRNSMVSVEERSGVKKSSTTEYDLVETEDRYLLNKCKIHIALLNKKLESASLELKCKKEIHELYIKTEKEKHEANKKRLEEEHKSGERRLLEAHESSERRCQSIHMAKLKLLARNLK